MYNENEIEKIKSMLKNFDENPEEMEGIDLFEQLGIDQDFLEKSLEKHFEKYFELKYIKISDEAVSPKYNYESDSGFDLHSIEEVTIESLGRALVSTGLRFDIPIGYEMQVRPKSGLSLKLGLTVLNTPGTVDSGYDGEIKVILFNASKEEIKITKGMKIAQAVISKLTNGKFIDVVEVSEIENKERGENGFGSTGITK